MLEELFKQNKLEYVHIETEKGRSVIFNVTLNTNIDNLRYLNINIYKARYEIEIDVS